MPPALPRQSRVVIVGSGVIGASVAWHLTRMGCSDVVYGICQAGTKCPNSLTCWVYRIARDLSL